MRQGERRDPEGPTDRLRADGPPRRAFIASAALGVGGFVSSLLVGGCAQREPEATVDDDLASLRQVDPKLVKYRETTRWESGFEEPRGLAVGPAGAAYLVGDRALRRFDADGTARLAVSLSAEPQCVAVSDDGSLFVGMPDHVQVCSPLGQPVGAWAPVSANAIVTGVAIGREQVYVANSAGREIVRYDRQGNVLGRFGHRDAASGYPGLIVPSPHLDVAVAPSGAVLVNNPGMHRVETHVPDGGMKGCWGEATSNIDGFCGCCNPVDFALLPDGRFVTAEKGIPRVKLYSAKGQFEGVVAAPDAFASNTMSLDLAALPDGRILVLDARAKAVRVFAPKAA